MYFTRLIRDTPDKEFRLERFDRFKAIAIVGASAVLRSKEEFELIRIAADREPDVACLDPVGDPQIAEKWLALLTRVAGRSVAPSSENWIAYFPAAALVGSSATLVDVTIAEQSDGDSHDPEVFARFFDETMKAIAAGHVRDRVVKLGVMELVALLRLAWKVVISNLF